MKVPLPRFAELPGASLPITPPFPFEGMSCRVFPLRASLNALQRFVDQYINIGPPEVARFRVSMPFVFLQILDYGKMAIEVNNYGWLSQREIVFNVPLEWYRVVDGRWRFHDWASIAPFIYVDNDMSMTVGRMVYGWPKTTASLRPTESGWVKDPRTPIDAVTVNTMVFPDLYAGSKLESQPLFKVLREAPASNLSLPLDARGAWAPWTIASNFAQSASVLMRDALTLLPGLGILPMHPGSSTENYLAMMAKMATMFFPFRPNLTANTINLKQFRMSEDPGRYCYQAITNGPMRFTALNGAGVLGEEHQMLGDVSGGYSVQLYQWPTLPIAPTLGLDVERRWRGPSCDIAVLKPVAPFWFNVNMVYEPGTTIAHRFRDGVWRDQEGNAFGGAPPARPDQLTYNTTLGASNRSLAGPFRFSNTTMRVLPLVARREKLEGFLDTSFNEALAEGPDGEGERLRLWAAADGPFAYVYLVITSVGDVTSGTDNIGDWADFEVAFCVPVIRETVREGKTTLRGPGFVQAFTFVDSETAAAAYAEVLGVPASDARFTVPPDTWMSPHGPASTADQALLQMDAEVLPVVGGGQKAVRRRILDVFTGYPPEVEADSWRILSERWVSILHAELDRKNATRTVPRLKTMTDEGRSLALAFLGARAPFTLYSLKQFRDLAQPECACYQSFVKVSRKLVEVLELREIEESLSVRVHEYPTLPLVDMLGLVAHPVRGEGGDVYALQPIRPFWIHGTLEEDLGVPIALRAGVHEWDATADSEQTYLDGPSDFGPETGLLLDLGDPRRMAKAALDWTSRIGHSAKSGIEPARVAEVLRTIDPQTIIESLLSREWGNWDPDARWQEGRRELAQSLADRLAGVPPDRIVETGTAFFDELVERRSPFHPWLRRLRIQQMAHSMKRFAELGRELEEAWEAFDDALRPHRGAAVPEKRELAERWKNFLTRAQDVAIEPLDVTGLEVQRDDNRHGLPHHEYSLAELLRTQGLAYWKATGLNFREEARDEVGSPDTLVEDVHAEALDQMSAFHKIVGAARARCQRPLDGLLTSLAKAWQKPDHVVYRGAVGPEADRLLPLKDSWDKDWYVGPRHRDEVESDPFSIFGPSPTSSDSET